MTAPIFFTDTETSGMAQFKKPYSDPSQPWTVQIGGIVAESVSLDQSAARIVVAPRGIPSVDQSAIGALITGKTEVKNGIIGLVIAGKVEGDFQTLFGRDAAIIFGAAFGLVFALVMRLTRRNKNEKD